MLTVNEIFYSIQGESTRAGEPCVFVRLTACDLRCSWCDTPYAFHEGRKMSIDDIMTAVEKHGCRLVEITGGEPLLQEDVYPLMDRLLAAGRTVMLETGGHRSIDRVPTAVRKIVDVKCPGSGEADRNDWQNLDRLAPHDEVKFVVKDRADYDFARRDRSPPSRVEAERLAVVSRPRRARSEDAVRVDARGSASRAPAAAAPQIHLVSHDPWRLGPSFS